MDKLAVWIRVRGQVRAYRAQLRFCVRVTVTGLSAFAIARSLAFPLHGLWAVLTAIVVTNVSVGASRRASIEDIVGTLGGAVYAAGIGLIIPHATATGQAVVLVLAVAPMALASATNPSFRVAPFSAVLVLRLGGDLSKVRSRRRSCAYPGGAAARMKWASRAVFPDRARGMRHGGSDPKSRPDGDSCRSCWPGSFRKLDTAGIRRCANGFGMSMTVFKR